jgi:hypothetical protein
MDADTQTLDVLALSHNEINLSNRTSGADITLNGIYAVGYSASAPVTFANGMLYNEIVLENNTIFSTYRAFESGNLLVMGNVEHNTFTVFNNNDTSAGWTVQQSTSTEIQGNVNNNHFTASNNTRGGTRDYGWQIAGDATITGSVTENTFTTSNNNASGNIDGYGLYLVEGNTIIQGNISSNTFVASNNSDLGVGWYIDFSADAEIHGNINDNTLILSGNDRGWGWWLAPDTGTIEGVVSGNRFTISSTTNSYGVFITLGSGLITFEQSITGNTMNIDGSPSGADGFNLSPGSGSINFEGNVDANELSTSNNGALVNPSVPTTGINYG